MVWEHPGLGDGPISATYDTKAQAEAFLAGMHAAAKDMDRCGQYKNYDIVRLEAD
jgi:hypothetical protein